LLREGANRPVVNPGSVEADDEDDPVWAFVDAGHIHPADTAKANPDSDACISERRRFAPITIPFERIRSTDLV
jgi:hypothetical protein